MGRRTQKYKRRSSRHKRSRRYRKKRGGRSRRRSRRRRRPRKIWGGMRKMPFGQTATLPVPPAFPPGAPYRPSSITNGLGHGYYYVKNEKVVDPPANISARAIGGGRKRRRKTRRRKHKKSRKRKRRSGRRGGGNTLVEAIPGGTDFRDVFWASSNSIRNLWNTWHGQPKNMSTSPSVQPIGRSSTLSSGQEPDMLNIVHGASLEAAEYK